METSVHSGTDKMVSQCSMCLDEMESILSRQTNLINEIFSRINLLYNPEGSVKTEVEGITTVRRPDFLGGIEHNLRGMSRNNETLNYIVERLYAII